MPVIRSHQQRQQKPIPRIANYPVIRRQQPPESKKVHVHDLRKKTVDIQVSKSSATSARDDEPAVLETTDDVLRKRFEDQECPGKSKGTAPTEKSVYKLGSNKLKQPRQTFGPCVRPTRTVAKQIKDSHPPVSLTTNAEVKKLVKMTVCKKKVCEAAKRRCSDKRGKVAEIESARSLAHESDIPVPLAKEDVPDSFMKRELEVPELVEFEDIVGKVEEYAVYSPDISKSESLGDEFHSVFSQETNADFCTPFESSDESEHDVDLTADYAKQDDPERCREDDDDDDDRRYRLNVRNMIAASDNKSTSGQVLDEDTTADYADGNAPLVDERPISSLGNNQQDVHDDLGFYSVAVNKKDSFFDFYDARGRPLESD